MCCYEPPRVHSLPKRTFRSGGHAKMTALGTYALTRKTTSSALTRHARTVQERVEMHSSPKAIC